MQSTKTETSPLDAEQSVPSPETGLPVDEFAPIVAQIQSNDVRGIEALHSKFARGLRYYFYRQMGTCDCEDQLHEVLLIVVKAIRGRSLREPERLAGFIRTVARRQIASHIDKQVKRRKEGEGLEAALEVTDSRANPEQQAMVREHAQIVAEALRDLGARDQEILIRFYLHEQPKERICSEMGLSEMQFRLSKSRAKAKFGNVGRKRLRCAA